MMEGTRKENLCNRSFGWINRQNNEVKPWLSKISDCFCTVEQTLPFSTKSKDFMENQKQTLELKDIPPPAHHTSSRLFPAAVLHPDHSLHYSQTPLQTGLKVSSCAQCSTESSGILHVHHRHGGGSIKPDSQGAGTITYEVGSGFPSLRSSPAISSFVGSSIKLPSDYSDSVTSPCQLQAVPPSSPHHLPCCGNIFTPLSPCHSSGHKLHHIPLHQSCTTSSCVSCTSFTGRAPGHLEHFHSPDRTAHLCTNSLTMNSVPPLCLKHTSHCDCLNQTTRKNLFDAAKVWPNIPPPSDHATSLNASAYDGCGNSMSAPPALQSSGLNKTWQNCVSVEASAAGQLQENLPPIGVFWDIENCSVPSGRSAVAVVQRIREKFFHGHREAEFICVCDISKENKEVIQELNNCQVTVAHINATSKNAADDKLRQSLRRFADTHTSPATVVLVSTDVNFASELSDLRHRHGFSIILIHKTQASEALLHHAHKLIPFEDFVTDLPPRLPVKSQDRNTQIRTVLQKEGQVQCHTVLYVYNLPTNRDGKSVSNRLRRLSDNCGGKVVSISSSMAVLRFANQESAERAQKRMENEDVFGNKIFVSFEPKNKEVSDSKSIVTGAEKSKSPKKAKNTKLCLASEQTADVKTVSGKNMQTAQEPPGKSSSVKSLQELCKIESKRKSKSQYKQQEVENRMETPSPQKNSCTVSSPDVTSKNVGTCESLCKNGKGDGSAARNNMNSPVDKSNEDARLQISSSSAFCKMISSRHASPLHTSQSFWSPRSGSPNPSNRSSPLNGNVENLGNSSEPSLAPFASGVEVQVSNLDYRMSRKELQQLLQDIFSKHGKVKNVDLSPHTDYQLKAIVHMEVIQEAVCAVSSLHRCKIGSKRIQVCLAAGVNDKSLLSLSLEVTSILQDAPASCLPLFKLTEIYEKKFGHKLTVSDLCKLSDTVTIRDQGNSRMVCLLSSSKSRQSPLGSSQSHDGSSASCSPVIFEELEYHEPFCKLHSTNKHYSETEFDPDTYIVPCVVLSIKTFSPQVHSLLQTHEGTVPLLSFLDCYSAEFIFLEEVQEGEGGVPLEHLITCVPGVNIVTAQNGIKVVKWIHNKPPPPNTDPWLLRSKSPVGNPQLIQFSREVIDLMKSQPYCIMPLSKFIPTYHHHFAKQCRVSDYGYSKLMELLEAVPHVLQILGMGSKRLVTLTHRAQIKRFTQDLMKLLKSQASKQVIVKEFKLAYHWCFSRDWDVTEYGTCELFDLLSEIPDTTVCVSQQDGEVIISIPKKERSQEEIEHTKQFAKEVVDLLRHQPHFRMPFNKFIPSYHHHFGRQCKLSYYGFTKLMELFEAIPEVLQVLECGEEKILTLTETERTKALAAQFAKLLRSQKDNCLMMSDLLTEYNKTFGYILRLQDYDASSVPALLQKLCHVVKVVDTPSGKQIQLINRKSLRTLTAQLLVLLMSMDGGGKLTVAQLKKQFETTHSTILNPYEYGFLCLSELLRSLPYLVEVTVCDEGEDYVQLTKLYRFAKNVRALLHTYHYQQIFMHEFVSAYTKYTGEIPQPKEYGYSNMEELLGAIPQVVWIKGHGHKRILVLKNDMKARVNSTSSSPAYVEDYGSDDLTHQEVHHTVVDEKEETGGSRTLDLQHPGTAGASQNDPELLCLTVSPVDLLCGPVPSSLPSPQLRPYPVVVESTDLIQFDEGSPFITDIAVSTDEEISARAIAETVSSHHPVELSIQVNEFVSQATGIQECKVNKEAVSESPVKKTQRNRVKLAARFSLAPVTRL